ncbi:hypothetical protein [Eggerthella sinensis]|nr:hypothetical protein [Eggerthella sinensis]
MSKPRIDDKTRSELCFAFAAFVAVYAVIVIAARGVAEGWW